MKKRSDLAVLVALAVGIAVLAVPVYAQFVYVANGGSSDVSAYSIGSTRTLTPIGLPAPAGLGPIAIAADPASRFVYVANRGSNNVSAYSFGPIGAVTPIGSPVPAGTGPEAVAVSGGRADPAMNKHINNRTDVSQFTLNWSAHPSCTVLRLTDDVMSQAGSAILKKPILLRPDSSFSTSFAFRISGINGSGPQGSDGMAFVIKSDPWGATALSVGGGNLRLGTDGSATAIPPRIAIEFDPHANFSFENDNNHVIAH